MGGWLVVCVLMDVIVAERAEQLRPEGFEGFYRNRWDELYRALAVTLRDPDLAREAVDEAMVRAFERWRQVRKASNPSGWVYRVALNWAIDQLRRRERESRRQVSPPFGAPWIPAVPEPELSAALGRLAVKHRAVVVLRVVLDWSEQDVASTLGIPVGTVKSRLSRALESLRQELEP